MKFKEFTRKNRYTVMLLALAAIVILFFTITKGNLLWRADAWSGMAFQFPEYGVMTVGLMLCFICGKMDMSFVMLGNFATIMMTYYIQSKLAAGYDADWNSVSLIVNNSLPQDQWQVAGTGTIVGVILVGMLIALAIAVIGGIINGTLVSVLNIPPVMATISMQLVWKGVSIGLTNGYALTGLPSIYSEIGHATVLGFLPVPMLIFIVIFAIAAFLVLKTTYGKKIYMIGTNEKAARYSAINTRRVVTVTYILCDVFATIGCMIMVSTLNSAKADNGTSYVMRCILILVLAGIMPDGGIGWIINALISIVTIQVIATGVNMFPKLNSYYGDLIWGGMLLIVLIANTYLLGGKRLARKMHTKITA